MQRPVRSHTLASGNWTTAGTWTPASCTGTYPGENVADIAGSVTIQAAHTVSLDATPANSFKDLAINGTLNANSGNGLTMTGTLSGAGTLNQNSGTIAIKDFTMSGAYNMSGTGLLTVSHDFKPNPTTALGSQPVALCNLRVVPVPVALAPWVPIRITT